jgi:UDP-N-acetylmuramoylalanine--D-glutamate ligase
MMAAMTKPRRQALVVGLGATGLSCVRYLRARGDDVTVVDSRPNPPALVSLREQFPDVIVHTGDFDAALFRRADLLVVSPGVALREPAIADAVAQGIPTVGDIELFVNETRGTPILAITGANGKSTVTSLVGAMCRAAGFTTEVAGNIGVPVLSLLERPRPDVYVLELSSFQLETTASLNARAATVLNITPDHMDRYTDVAEYAAAKARIFAGDGVVVINADDPAVVDMAPSGRQIVRFSLGIPVGADDFGLIEHAGETWLARGQQALIAVREVVIPGRHNLANVLAAMALAQAQGVSVEAMRAAVREFKGLDHRSQVVAEKDGVQWINDSKGTNVGATVAALAGMTRPVVLIAGGDGKGADFAALKPVVAEHARAVVLIGRDAPQIEAALAGAVRVVHASDMSDAVRRARAVAQPGDAVLLSPACASFDMFKNYEHRGHVFAQAVRELLA